MPEVLEYRRSGIAAHKAPLAARIRTREFWGPVLPAAARDAGRDGSDANARKIAIRTTGVVVAEGLTHHQAALVPLALAQRDAGIKYRALGG